MSGLPPGWSHATIEQLAGAQGLTTDGDWIETKDQDPDGDVRLIQLADIGDGEFRDRSVRFVTSDTARRLNCTLLEENDLLIARMPDPLGRACIFPGVGQPAITAVDVFVWRPSPDAPIARWLMHFVNSEDVRNKIAEQAGGTTRQRIAGGRVKRLEIPVPPLPEQHRIVAKIDSLSAKSRRARDQLDHIPRLVEKYKQAILAAAFRGDLTREWRASVDNKGDWETTTIGAVVTDIRYGTAKKCEYDAGRVSVLRIPNVQKGFIVLDDLKSAEFGTSELKTLRLELGDILVIRSNGSLDLVGRSAVVDAGAVGMLFAGYLIRLRLDHRLVTANFVQLHLRAAETRARLERLAKSTSGVNNINSSQIKALPLLRPDIGEQHEIVSRIEAAFRWIDRLASEATSARKLIDHLDQAILAKAFRGELVPQDPNDEPASVLLERIRAERATAPVKAKAGKVVRKARRQGKPRR